jgi:DNA-binding CsgD family transcriptional regulator/tetratricopeptide (TPR) repeat protein
MAELEQLAVALVPNVAPDELVDLARRSGGNPLFAEQLVAHSGAASGVVPPSLTSTIVARLDSLGPAPRHVLDLMATAARPLPTDLLAAATEYSPQRLERALRALRREGLTAEVVKGEYAVRHSLVAEIAYSSLSAERRRSTHAMLAKALAQSGRDFIPSSAAAAERAYHLRMSNQLQDARSAFVEAARVARDAHAYAEATGHYEAAVTLSRLPGQIMDDWSQQVALLQEAGEVAFAAGDAARAASLIRDALEVVPSDQPQEEGRLRRRLGSYLLGLVQDRDAITQLEMATRLLANSSDQIEHGRAIGTLGAAFMLVGSYRQCRRFSRAALRSAHATGDTFMQSQALNFLGVAEANLGQIDVGLRLLERAVELGRLSGRADAELEAVLNRSEILQIADQLNDASSTALAAADRASILGLADGVGAMLQATAATALFHRGEWQRAVLVLRQALRTTSLPEARANMRALLARLQVARGDFVAARRTIASSRADAHPERVDLLEPVIIAEADVAYWTGDLATARDVANEGLRSLPPLDAMLPRLRLLGLIARIESTAARRASLMNLPTKQREAAAAAQTAANEAERTATSHRAPAGVQAERQMIVAEARRANGCLSADLWLEVRDLWQVAGRPYRFAYANVRLAEAALGGGDREMARVALNQARRSSELLGAKPLERAATDVAKRARIRLTPNRPDTQQESPAMGLTGREAEVLRLITQGLTNRRIAQSLFVSEATVATHVSHVLSKLGARTRREAAVLAAEHQVDL